MPIGADLFSERPTSFPVEFLMSFDVAFIAFIFGSSLLLASCIYAWARRHRMSTLSLPPGPRGMLFLGNAFDMPTEKPWLTFKRWADTYGDIVHLRLPFQPTIVIGSIKAAVELMEKRSSIYSDRPWLAMDEISGWEWDFALLPYGPKWRARRRCFHQYFHQGVVADYQPTETREIRAFLRRLLTDNFSVASVRQMTATIVVGISYGKEILNMEDEYIHLVQTALEGIIQTKRPGAFWMDYFPILKHIPAWVPGATGRKLAERYVPVVRAMRDQPFYSAKDDVLNGTAGPSVVRTVIEKLQSQPSIDAESCTAEEEIARDALGLAYSAGVDTSLITTLVFFLAMALRPDVQKKAQAELDNVLGPGKLPTFEDRESLPYVEAIILESIRWMPAVPLGVSHRVLVEDEYKGYRIPKGSIIIPNSWAMLHNAEDYPSPEEFNPDRFIANGALDPDVLDPSLIAFGFGRRVCPGRYLAKDILYLTVASILYVYDIFPAADKMGNPVKLSSEQKTGFLSYPETLDCVVKPRSTLATQLILDSVLLQ